MKREELRADDYLAIPKWVLERDDLTLLAKLVLSVYIDCLGEANDVSWPGPDYLARKLHVDPGSVKRVMRSLIVPGIMIPLGLSGENTKKTRVYRIERPPLTGLIAHPVQIESGAQRDPYPVRNETPTRCAMRPKALYLSMEEKHGKEEASGPIPFLTASKVVDSQVSIPEAPTLPSASPVPASAGQAHSQPPTATPASEGAATGPSHLLSPSSALTGKAPADVASQQPKAKTKPGKVAGAPSLSDAKRLAGQSAEATKATSVTVLRRSHRGRR